MSRAKQRLREKGIGANEVSASRMMHVPHTDLVVAAKGDPLFDPRSLDPVDELMAVDMAERVTAGECPNRLALLVWERPGVAGLLVGDGHGRTRALVMASQILNGRTLMPLVEFYDGDEKGFLLERARRNDHDRFARRDAPSVLAFRVKQLTAVGASEAEIVCAMPRDVGPAEVEALTRWSKLATELRPRFDVGEAPLGLLAAVLEVARQDQAAKLDALLAAGVRTGRAAKRVANKAKDERDPWARRMSPRQAVRLANALFDDIAPEVPIATAKAYIAIGLRIGSSREPKKLLSTLPTKLRSALEAARVSKAGAK